MSDSTSRQDSLVRKLKFSKAYDKEGLVYTWVRQGVIRSGKDFKIVLDYLRPKSSTNIIGEKK